MKKLSIIITLLTSLFLTGSGQNDPNWVQPAEDYYKNGSMLTKDSDGNAISVGDRSAFVGDANIFTRKVDVEGNLIWEQTEPSGISQSYLRASWVNCDGEDNILVSGFRYSGVSIDYTDSIITLKYDNNGNLLWRKGISHPFPSGLPMRSEVDPEGNLYIGSISLDTGFSLIKIDPNGNILFEVTDASTSNQSFSSMRVKNGMAVLSGYGGNGTIACVVAFDTDGNSLWAHSFDSSGGTDVEIDENNNVYVLSRKQNQVGNSSQFDIKIIKLNYLGDEISQFDFDFENSTEFATRMTLVNQKITVIGSRIPQQGGYMDWITFQTDLEGNLLWQAIYNEMPSNDEKPSWVTALENGDVYVSGQGGPGYEDFNGSVYLQYVTLRYSAGNIEWVNVNPYQGYIGIVNVVDNDCGLYVLGETSMTMVHYLDSCETVQVNETTAIHSDFIAYPNSFMDKVNLQFSLVRTEGSSLMLMDLMGRTVYSIQPDQLVTGSNKIEIDLSNLSSGLYLARLVTPQNTREIQLIKN